MQSHGSETKVEPHGPRAPVAAGLGACRDFAVNTEENQAVKIS